MIRRKGNKKAWALLLVMLALFCAWIPREHAAATSTMKLVITEIDYEKETMTIVSNYGDTRLYYSDAKQKNWECAYGEFKKVDGKSYKEYVLDISWIKKTKDYVLTLKGDKSSTVVSVTLPKQQTNFKVTLDYTKGTFTYLNHMDEKVSVYWRKNGSTTWELADSAVMQRFYARGASLYFRLGQVKGTSETNVGKRPSKEVKLSIAKQAAAPTVTITTATQVLTLSALLQYQVYVDGALVGDTATWTTASNKKLSIPNDVAKSAYCSVIGGNDSKEVQVVFRTAATAKKPASLEKTVTIKAQEAAPSNVKVKIESAEALSLAIEEITTKVGEETEVKEGASSSNPYEYTIVAPGGELNLATATWKAITSTSPILLNKEKVPPASVIYVRKKAHVADNDKAVYYPESQCYSYTVGNYSRAESKVELVEGKTTDYAYIEKTENNEEIIRLVKEEGKDTKELQFQIVVDMKGTNAEVNGDGSNSPTEIGGTELSKVTINSIVCNNIELKFSYPEEDNAAKTEGDTAKTSDDTVKAEDGTAKIIVNITPDDKFESAVAGNTAYPLVIKLSNGEVLNDKVTLTILKKASLKQEYLLGIIQGAKYTSLEDNPNRFVVVSTRKLKKDGNGNYQWADVTSVKLNGQELAFDVEKDAADGTIEVILKQDGTAASGEKKMIDSVLSGLSSGKKYSLEVTVGGASDEPGSEGTKITEGIEVIYTTEATTVEGTTWQRTKILSEDFEGNLEIRMSYKTPGVSIADVTLYPVTGSGTEISIMGNCYVDNQYVYAVLSKEKINKIDTTKISIGTVYKVQVRFSNNAVVDTGCRITFRN